MHMVGKLEKKYSANEHLISVPVRLRTRPYKVVTPPYLGDSLLPSSSQTNIS